MQTVDQPDALPTRKVGAAGASGAASIVLVWLIGLAGVEVPPEVAASIATLLSFAGGYLVRERAVPDHDHAP